jgi:hypothetical protein
VDNRFVALASRKATSFKCKPRKAAWIGISWRNAQIGDGRLALPPNGLCGVAKHHQSVDGLNDVYVRIASVKIWHKSGR